MHRSSTDTHNRPSILIPCLCLAGIAFIAAIFLPFWPNRTHLLDMGKIIGYSGPAFAIWFSGLGIWIASLWSLCVRTRNHSFGELRAYLVPTVAVVFGCAIALYPASAIDVFIYAARSRLFSHYGENPNAAPPVIHWETDPFMAFASREWADNVSPYGPLWNILAYPITWVSTDNIGLAIVGFKLLSVASILVIAWLIHDTVKRTSPGWELPATLFWLLNPLVIWDGIGNAHNDVTIMAPVILAIWAWHRGLDRWVVPALLASILIKYVTILLLPVAIVAVWRRNADLRDRLAGIFLAIGAGSLLLLVSLFPFFDIDAVRESARAQGMKVAVSPAWAVKATLAEWNVLHLDSETVVAIVYALMLLYVVGWTVACWRHPQWLPRAMFEVLFGFMLVASTNQRAWYVIWIVPLAAILIPATPWRRTAVWSTTAMLQHACMIWLWSVWSFDRFGSYGYALTIVGIVFLPVIAVTLWEWTNAFATYWQARRTQRAESR